MLWDLIWNDKKEFDGLVFEFVLNSQTIDNYILPHISMSKQF